MLLGPNSRSGQIKAKPSRAKPGRTNPDWTNPDRTKPARTNPVRAKPPQDGIEAQPLESILLSLRSSY